MTSEVPKGQDTSVDEKKKSEFEEPDVKSEASIAVQPDPDTLKRALAELGRDESS